MSNRPIVRDQLAEQLDRIEALLRRWSDQQPRREWYTVAEFAAIATLAPFTVRKYCRDGRLNAQKRGVTRGQTSEWVLSHEEYLRYERDGLLPPTAPNT